MTDEEIRVSKNAKLRVVMRRVWKMRKQNITRKLELSIHNSRLNLHFETSDGKVGGNVDITPVYHFLKDFFNSIKIK